MNIEEEIKINNLKRKGCIFPDDNFINIFKNAIFEKYYIEKVVKTKTLIKFIFESDTRIFDEEVDAIRIPEVRFDLIFYYSKEIHVFSIVCYQVLWNLRFINDNTSKLNNLIYTNIYKDIEKVINQIYIGEL